MRVFFGIEVYVGRRRVLEEFFVDVSDICEFEGGFRVTEREGFDREWSDEIGSRGGRERRREEVRD